ncbi:MAG: VOC family protein [Myxococcota bacterium]
MGISHIALAVKDIEATHRFYTDVMGFSLVKVEIVPQGDAFARHVFYSTGPDKDQLIAFWDLSAVRDASDLKTAISRDLGLDPLTNHIAFQADSVDDLEVRKRRWLEAGCDVLEIDHGWIKSVYTEDPDRITIEFAVLTRPFSDADAEQAIDLLRDPTPPLPERLPRVRFHRAKDPTP